MYEHGVALTQRAIEGFNDAGLALGFGAGAVRACWQGLGVGGKQVGEVSALAAVAFGQGLPQVPGRGRVALAQHPSHDAPAGALDGQPKPDLAPLAADKRPHLVQLKRLPAPALGLFRP